MSSNLVLKWKYYYNKCLDSMKTRQVNRCKVVIFTNEYKTYFCQKYTYTKYCNDHRRLLREECEKYHLYNVVSSSNLAEASLIEYKQRQKYAKKYNITIDYNHYEWESYLESIWTYHLLERYGFIVDKKFLSEMYFLDFINLVNL